MRKMTRILVLLLLTSAAAARADEPKEDPRDAALFKTSPAGRALLEGQRFKAIRLAQKELEDRAEDWTAQYILGMARMRVGQLTEAREALAEAVRLAQAEPLPVLRLAETYTREAQKRLARLASGLVRPDVTDFEKVVYQLKEAGSVLSKGRPQTARGKNDLAEARGLALEQIGAVYRLEARYHQQLAKSTGQRLTESFRKRYERAAEAAERNATDSYRGAAALLTQVLKSDPNRAPAAGALYRVARASGSSEALARAEKAILAMPDPPVAERLGIMVHRLERGQQGRSQTALQKQLQADMAFIDKVLARDPKNVLALQLGASLALAMKDYAKTQSLAETLLHVEPNHRVGRLLVAEAMLRQGQVAKAERELARIKAVFDKWDAAHAAYAEAAHEAGKDEAAKRAAEKALELNPDNARAKHILAVLSGQEPDHPEAIQRLKEAAAKDPRAVLAFVKWAKDNSKTDVARKVLGELETEYAKRADMIQVLAAGYKALGDEAKAMAMLKSLAKVQPATGAGRVAVAAALLAQGEVDKAEKLLTEAIAADAKDAKAHFLMGRIHEHKKHLDKALASYRRALDLDGAVAPYRLALARALVRKGQLDQARSVLEGGDTSDPAAALLLTQLDMAQGRESNASQLLQGAEAGGTSALAMAVVSLRQGKADEAIQIARKALQDPKVDNAAGYHMVLAQGYLLQDKPDQAKASLREIIRLHPDKPAGYRILGRLLRKDLGWPELRTQLAAAGGADAVEADLAVGEMMIREKKTTLAPAVLEPIADSASAKLDQRARARLLLAECFTQDKRLNEALAQLGRLRDIPAWRGRALDAIARVQIAAGQTDAALATLAERRKQAVADKDTGALEGVIRMLLAMKRPADARPACEAWKTLDSTSPKPYLMTAQVEAADGKAEAAVAAVRTAVRKAPKSIQVHLALANLLAQTGRREEALRALDVLSVQGPAAKTAAMGARGQLLAGWGLFAPAAEAFAVAATGEGDTSAAVLARGRALAALGRKAEARTVLGGIDSLSKAYVAAQLALADLADSKARGAEIALAVHRARPGVAAALNRAMALLIDAGKAADAADLLKQAAEKKHAISPETVLLGLRAMLEAHERDQAAGVCMALASQTRQGRWRSMAALLKSDVPSAALALLPGPSEAGLHDTLIGLALSASQGKADAVGAWQGRLVAIERALAAQSPPQTIPAHIRLLAALAARSAGEARRLAMGISSGGLGESAAARELANRSDESGEAARLLLAEVAMELGLTDLARETAMAVLQKRPTCQWAAVVIGRNNPDDDALTKALSIAQPATATAVRALRGMLLTNQGKHTDALDVYKALVRAEPSDVALQIRRAMAAERAGELEQALTWYTALVEATGHPVAANNAAYLLAVLHPKDRDRLVRAEGWVNKAIKLAPRMVALRDTRGWIVHLLGRTGESRDDIRLAVQADPTSVENHYHLGVVERMMGAQRLARWHLEAAVAMARRRQQDGEKLTRSATDAVAQAKRILAATQ